MCKSGASRTDRFNRQTVCLYRLRETVCKVLEKCANQLVADVRACMISAFPQFLSTAASP